jgi:hypothetical protein
MLSRIKNAIAICPSAIVTGPLPVLYITSSWADLSLGSCYIKQILLDDLAGKSARIRFLFVRSTVNRPLC